MSTVNYMNLCPATDKKLARLEEWDTATTFYFTDRAKRKHIPTDHKGFRLFMRNITTWFVTVDGKIYSETFSKFWDRNGVCHHSREITMETDIKTLKDSLNADCSVDNWGNSFARVYEFIDGKSVPLGLSSTDKNTAKINRLVNGWFNDGYTLFSKDEI